MEWAEYSNNMFEKYKKAGKPFQASFEMTPFCNFRCNMCYIRLDPEQAKAQGKLLSTEQWLRIASEARKMGIIILEVTGGEVTTRQDFPFLYETFIKMGFLIHIRTNGYLIKDETLDLLKKYKPRRISVTMYGASDETYRKVCEISDGFSVVSKNVLAMRDAGINVRLTMTVTNDNVNEIKALKHWAQENDMSITPFGGLFKPVRGAERSIEHLQVQMPEEECEITEEIEQFAKKQTIDRPILMNPFWMCRGFGAKCCISWDGRMTICNTLTSIWQDVSENGFENAYNNLYNDLKGIKRPKECSDCPYIELCAACPSQLLSATGNPEKTCESICKLARRRYKLMYLMKKEKQLNIQDDIMNQCEEGE